MYFLQAIRRVNFSYWLGRTYNFAWLNATIPNVITILGIYWASEAIIRMYHGFYDGETLNLVAKAMITDFLDGFFARLLNQTTYVGAGLDRFRDKLIAIPLFLFSWHSFFIINQEMSWLAGYAVRLILCFLMLLTFIELALLGIGVWGASKGLSIEANKWGKRKMVSEIVFMSLWLLVITLNPLGFTITSPLSLVTFLIVLFISLLLAGKSLDGYWEIYVPQMAKTKELPQSHTF